jgi:cytochrome c5
MESRLRVRVRGAATFLGATAVIFTALASMASAQPPATDATATAKGAQAQPGQRGDAIDPAHAAATVQSLCSKCHDIGLVTSARYDRAGWQEVLQRMYGHGLVASDEEAKEVLDYLAAGPSPSQ